MSGRKKLQLPKSVLDMKFMKKSKDRIEKELENTKDHDLYASSITTEMRQATGNFITETSYLACVDLMEGRLSFKGMNPEIESLMEAEKKKNEDVGEMQKDVSDEVLAKTMITSYRKRHSGPTKYSLMKKKK